MTAGALTVLVAMGGGCSISSDPTNAATAATSSDAPATTTSDAPESSGDGTTPTGAATTASETSPDLSALVSEVQGTFQQFVYSDSQTGASLPYNLYLPPDYDPTRSYPLVLYVADSSLVGQDVTAPLSQYGALIWASDSEQAKHPSIVLVPEYPSVIIDDHGSYTTTEYVDMTARLVEAVSSDYSVDPDRIYGTGQSMGAMTVMYLAAQQPDLFAAELIVSGQWDVSTLANLASERFIYAAAAGDERASAGQAEVESMVAAASVPYSTLTLDATSAATELTEAAAAMLSEGNSANFVTFAAGTVVAASGSGGGGTSSEHMTSFQPTYQIAALRDWLFAQTG